MRIKELTMKYGITPSKRLGQNFLVNKGIIEKIINAAGIKPEDVVLEIGPGLGVLTEEMAKRAKKVIAVEKDIKLIGLLKEELKSFNNLEVIQGDALEYEIRDPNYKIVSNLPFYAASPIIRRFLEVKNRPQEMVLLIQKEVAQRICAKPPKMNILAISVQLYSEPKIISHVSKGSFWPSPKVDASIIKIKLLNKAKLSEDKTKEFFRIVKAGFSHPRKQLVSNLSKELKIKKNTAEDWLLSNNLNPKQRSETLTVEEWIKLANFPPNTH